MKYFIYIIMLLVFSFTSMATPITINTAKFVASQFFKGKDMECDTSELKLVYYKNTLPNSTYSELFYVFNRTPTGFVIIAADDNIYPVLAWFDNTVFDTSYLPLVVNEWLDKYENQINFAITHHLNPKEETKLKWQELLNENVTISKSKTTGISPLLKTNWNQNGYFNYLCPYDKSKNQKTLTGCVATMMAQLMKYWQWPVKGIGSHYYTDSSYGLLSANYYNAVYEWALMPNSLSSYNLPIASLMFQTGVSVNMEYGTGSSSAYVLAANCPIKNNAQYALVNYFGYKTTMQGVRRMDYNDGSWLALIKQEINAGRPVVYNGANDSEGHSFIADGYDDNDNLHFNWGWGGAFNGYFSIGNIVPDSISLMKDNTAVVGIEPDKERMIVMGDSLFSTTTIYQKLPFSITTKVINVNTATFTGNITAVLTSDYYKGYSFTKKIANQNISWGDSLSLLFQFEGILPGSYHIQLFYQQVSGNLIEVTNTADFFNNTSITVFGDSVQTHCTVFPNPVVDYLFINLNNSKSSFYKIMDATGRVLLQNTIDASLAVVAIPIYNIEGGIYFVELSTPKGMEVQKFVIGR